MSALHAEGHKFETHQNLELIFSFHLQKLFLVIKNEKATSTTMETTATSKKQGCKLYFLQWTLANLYFAVQV